jgi:acyl carrier protein
MSWSSGELEMAESRVMATVVELVRRLGKVSPTVLVTEDSRFVEDLGIDSLDLVSLFLRIQDRYSVEIDDADFPELTTVGRLCSYIADRQGVAAA